MSDEGGAKKGFSFELEFEKERATSVCPGEFVVKKFRMINIPFRIQF